MRWVVLALACAVVAPAAAQQPGFTAWLNARIDSVAAVRIALRDGVKEVALPAGMGSGASLIDRAAMPDLAGISVQWLSPLSSGAGGTARGTGISGTPYLLLALLQGASPLDPSAYLHARLVRRFGLSVAFETDDATGATTTVLQTRLRLLDRGDPLADADGRVSGALRGATGSYQTLAAAIQDLLYLRVGRDLNPDRTAFINALTQGPVLTQVLARAGARGQATIDRLIEAHIASFVTLRDTVAALTTEARARPALAVGVTAHATGNLTDNVRALVMFDWMARPTLDVTVNAGIEHARAVGATAERTWFQAAAQLLVRVTPEDQLGGRAPLTTALAASAAIGNDTTWRLQAKLNLPVAAGVMVPISVTWASRTDLVNEDRVLGHVGFSFDTGQIFAAMR